MFTVFVVLAVIIAILLTIVVLVQNSKGGGLSANFSSTNNVMGVRKTTDFLEKTTWALAIILVVLCVGSAAFMFKGESESKVDSFEKQIIEHSAPAQTAPLAPVTLPAAPAAEQAPAATETPAPAAE